MTCYHPMHGFRRRDGGWTRSRRLSFRAEPLTVPCGKCIGCRIDRSRQMAVRCVHEASRWPVNSFLTLTYRDEFLPPGGSLNHRDFQLFMKRLRKALSAGGRVMRDDPVRFYMCGEYGETSGRPHYHALMFNLGFDDKVLFKVERGVSLFTSQYLTDIWGLGHCTIGDVTFESAAYVSRYVMKKINGKLAIDFYSYTDPETGEVFDLKPEYCQPSRGGRSGRGGIARDWFEEYASDVFPDDFVILGNRKFKVPRYYSKLFELADPGGYAEVKARRKEFADRRAADSTPDRLRVRERVQRLKVDRLKRSLE